MTTYEEIIEPLVDSADTSDVECLTEMTSEFIEKVRSRMPQEVEQFLMKIDLKLNPHFTEESSKYAVAHMDNEDGTVGEHWNYSTTSDVLRSKSLMFTQPDWYYVLNMMYSDYYDEEMDDDYYIDLAIDFLKDKDAPEGKAKKYYLAMCK